MSRQSNLRYVLAILAAVVLILAGTACHHETKPVAASKVKAGTILGLTGDNATYGQKMQRGFDFAKDEAGSAIDLIIEDSQFDPTKAVTAYRKLTSADGAKLIIGVTGSRNAIPVCEAAKNDPVVIVDALSSAPKISTQCGGNYFRIMASDALAGRYNAHWAAENGAKKVAIVYMEDDWGTSYRDSVLKYLKEANINDSVVASAVAGSRDFRSQVEQLRKFQPDAIFLLLYASEGSSFMQQLRQAGLKAPVYGSDNISSPEFTVAGSDVVEGVRVAMPAPAAGQAYSQFVDRYRAKYHEDPDANVIKSYDAFRLAADAIAKVGSDPAKLTAYLHGPGYSYTGISGLIRFEPNGDLASQEYTRMVYRGGKLEAFRG